MGVDRVGVPTTPFNLESGGEMNLMKVDEEIFDHVCKRKQYDALIDVYSNDK